MNSIKPGPVAVIGAGVIGGGWTARFLLNGIDVKIHDPNPEAGRRLTEMIANAERAWDRLTSAPLPKKGSLSFCGTIQEAVDGAVFIEECIPENLELKRKILNEIETGAATDVPIGSSTSGIRPSEMQSEMKHPERLLVTHPFNPVYLLPLVELCGGHLTDPEVIGQTSHFLESLGMRPLKLKKEIDGFLSDRLLEAVWRESLWLVHDDVATVEDMDDALRFGPGLRFALMGSFLIYRIAGGEEGMRHFMAQFGPALKWPWTKLMEVPELTDEFLDKLASQSDAQA
ncbi:MAG: 3-hydroxyacyl-CoA dehydrogenase NAD-binding domain-containing protein, partial [SAR324 cluster bacterium]|nr:3-hydroxyacyl-CoA dehydrogenase NAD-binding domain-containing protein [SAR324 cluster bacterium]